MYVKITIIIMSLYLTGILTDKKAEKRATSAIIDKNTKSEVKTTTLTKGKLAPNLVKKLEEEPSGCTKQQCMEDCRKANPNQIITNNTNCAPNKGCVCEFVHKCGTNECDKSCRDLYGPTFQQNCTGNRLECYCDERCEEQHCFQSCTKLYPEMKILKSMCLPSCMCQYTLKCNTPTCDQKCKEKFGKRLRKTTCTENGICDCVENCDEDLCLKDCMKTYPAEKGRYVKSATCDQAHGQCNCNFGTECNSPACEELCRKEFGDKYANTQRCANGKDCVCMLKE